MRLCPDSLLSKVCQSYWVKAHPPQRLYPLLQSRSEMLGVGLRHMGLVGDTVHLITVPLYEIQGRLGSQVGFCLWGNDLGEYVSWSFLFFVFFGSKRNSPGLLEQLGS